MIDTVYEYPKIFAKDLEECDLTGIGGRDLFRILCKHLEIFNYWSFGILVTHGIEFFEDIWNEYYNEHYNDPVSKLAELFWMYDLEMPQGFAVDYHKLIPNCIVPRLQEKLFREILDKNMFHDYEQSMMWNACTSDQFETLFNLLVNTRPGLSSIITCFVCTKRALKYFVKEHGLVPRESNLMMAIMMENHGAVEYLLEWYVSVADVKNRIDFIFMDFNEHSTSSLKICETFILHGICHVTMKPIVQDHIRFCADHYFPGLEEVCPMSFDLMIARKKTNRDRYRLTKNCPSDLLVICSE